jgi:hypothetical protein
MPLTIRKYWGKFQGRTTLNFNWNAIDHGVGVCRQQGPVHRCGDDLRRQRLPPRTTL